MSELSALSHDLHALYPTPHALCATLSALCSFQSKIRNRKIPHSHFKNPCLDMKLFRFNIGLRKQVGLDYIG
jgi:hypothetical protein